MKPLDRGLIVALLQCLIVTSTAGVYAWDRERLPRVWAKASPSPGQLALRGRYLQLQLEVDFQPDRTDTYPPARLAIVNGRLTAYRAAQTSMVRLQQRADRWSIVQPVAYFVPERSPLLERRHADEELWVEVSVQPDGPPRPLRLGRIVNCRMEPRP